MPEPLSFLTDLQYNCLYGQELALKLRVEGRSYDPKVFKKKQKQKDGANKHPKAKVKIKSSQRNKAPYHVSQRRLPACWCCTCLPLVWSISTVNAVSNCCQVRQQ